MVRFFASTTMALLAILNSNVGILAMLSLEDIAEVVVVGWR